MAGDQDFSHIMLGLFSSFTFAKLHKKVACKSENWRVAKIRKWPRPENTFLRSAPRFSPSKEKWPWNRLFHCDTVLPKSMIRAETSQNNGTPEKVITLTFCSIFPPCCLRHMMQLHCRKYFCASFYFYKPGKRYGPFFSGEFSNTTIVPWHEGRLRELLHVRGPRGSREKLGRFSWRRRNFIRNELRRKSTNQTGKSDAVTFSTRRKLRCHGNNKRHTSLQNPSAVVSSTGLVASLGTRIL